MIECPFCETKYAEKHKTGRSLPQHKRYFALLRAAFAHAPESVSSQYANEYEFRKMMEMKAGWRTIAARIPVSGMNPDKLRFIAEAAFKAAGTHAVPVVHKGELVIFTPRSIAFDKLEHLEACRLFDAVAVVIEQETGLKADQLLSEKAA
jgi:hypothetical protein